MTQNAHHQVAVAGASGRMGHMLTEAIGRVLNDPAVAADLRARGVERAKELRWDRTARRTLEVLRQVAAHQV